ncbi:MAG: isoprenylcysteine carboxylmethyltransferase family protein [Calditrichaeota bacterium]|nr:MAG: isoprenylcysteine carboxylmethyltransferase family protein [Calditrichota bacterium]
MIYVIFQFTFLFALYFSVDYHNLHALSLLLIVWGGVWGLWAIAVIGWRRVHILPEVRETTRLTTHGPYRFTRHPMYSALIFTGLGAVLTRNNAMSWLLFVGLVIALGLKIRYEEKQLRKHFPEYAEYSQKVRRIIPFLI